PLPRATTLERPATANERSGLTDQSRRDAPAPMIIRPQTAPRDDESNSRASEATNDNPRPIIRVTIGRIDVRAVNAPPPPVRRETPPTPKLSLEEYLRSRSGRKQ